MGAVRTPILPAANAIEGKSPEVQFGIVGISKCMRCSQLCFCSRQVFEVEGMGKSLQPDEEADQRFRLGIERQILQGKDVIFPAHRWHDDAHLFTGLEFSIHHDPRNSAVAIIEGMHFSDDKHDEDGATQGFPVGETVAPLGAVAEQCPGSLFVFGGVADPVDGVRVEQRGAYPLRGSVSETVKTQGKGFIENEVGGGEPACRN